MLVSAIIEGGMSAMYMLSEFGISRPRDARVYLSGSKADREEEGG